MKWATDETVLKLIVFIDLKKSTVNQDLTFKFIEKVEVALVFVDTLSIIKNQNKFEAFIRPKQRAELRRETGLWFHLLLQELKSQFSSSHISKK